MHQNNNQPQGPYLPMMNTPYYGGTVEHWFNSKQVEAINLDNDMFTGKCAQPKLELLFGPVINLWVTYRQSTVALKPSESQLINMAVAQPNPQ